MSDRVDELNENIDIIFVKSPEPLARKQGKQPRPGNAKIHNAKAYKVEPSFSRDAGWGAPQFIVRVLGSKNPRLPGENFQYVGSVRR